MNNYFLFSYFYSVGGNNEAYQGEIFDFIEELASKRLIDSFQNTKEELEHRLISHIKANGGSIEDFTEEQLIRFLVS